MEGVLAEVNRHDPVIGLIPNPDAQFTGYVFRMDYGSALVMTNDLWRDQVGGLPLGCILVATDVEFSEPASANPDSAFVVVLRVRGPSRLPSDDETMRACIEMHQQRKTRVREDEHDGFDGMTHGYRQWGGLECRILGTFFKRDARAALGADVEDFPSAVHYRVYKPIGDGLSSIINFIDPAREAAALRQARDLGFAQVPPPVRIGAVRYTSANKKHLASGAAVPVHVQPFDLLARRTGVFGMTRTGKSNTTKTIVSEIALAATAGGQKVGQLIFDMNGEYANANHQDDGSSLAEVFEPAGLVVRYRGRETPGFLDLRPNFYEDFEASLSMLQSLLGADPNAGQSQEFRTFLTLNLPEPDASDRGKHKRWEVKRALFHALLAKANFQAPESFRIKFSTSRQIIDAVGQQLMPDGSPNDWLAAAGGREVPRVGIECRMTPANAVIWFEAANPIKANLVSSGQGGPWLDNDAIILIDMLTATSTARGGTPIVTFRVVERQRAYHSPSGTADVAADIYGHLKNGKIVILDLSVGIESVRIAMGERVARHILSASMEAFHSGEMPTNIVLYVEEAHNLIGRDAEPDETWPRIAKEGAKARLALVYATQEPSSVQPNILANTENVFCTHLNNDDEIRVLSKYYDFSDFSESIKSAQDVGFARIKTLSAPFVIPTQIDKFDPRVVGQRLAAIPSTGVNGVRAH